MKRGEIWWALLEPRSGSEQRGRRPVVVVSNDGFNRVDSWGSVIVVPLSTSGAQARRGPTSVPLDSPPGRIERGSVVLCHQVTTLDRTKLIEAEGTLSTGDLERVEAGLRAALDLA